MSGLPQIAHSKRSSRNYVRLPYFPLARYALVASQAAVASTRASYRCVLFWCFYLRGWHAQSNLGTGILPNLGRNV
jgi:hypothetical protein